MDRRRFLATGATVAVALTGGCAGCASAPTATLEMTPVSDAEIARRATHRTPPANAPEYDVLRQAVTNGTAVYSDTRASTPENRPSSIPTNTNFVFNGSVYRLSADVTDTHPVTVYRYTVDPPDGEVDESETIRYEDLPEIDKQKLSMANPDVIGFSTSFQYTATERENSALVPAPDHSVIVWGPDTRGRMTIDDSSEAEVKTYRYTSTEVNPSAAAYGAQIRKEYVFTLSDLPSSERDILEQVLDEEGSYTVAHDRSTPEALTKLADRFRPQTKLSGASEADAVSGNYLVRYGGTVYWTRFTYRATTAST